ncbi:unnamed protein product, partial [Penicillium nalgiovense]
WRYRHYQIRELIASKPIPEPNTLTEGDIELYNDTDEEILHKRN